MSKFEGFSHDSLNGIKKLYQVKFVSNNLFEKEFDSVLTMYTESMYCSRQGYVKMPTLDIWCSDRGLKMVHCTDEYCHIEPANPAVQDECGVWRHPVSA